MPLNPHPPAESQDGGDGQTWVLAGPETSGLRSVRDLSPDTLAFSGNMSGKDKDKPEKQSTTERLVKGESLSQYQRIMHDLTGS